MATPTLGFDNFFSTTLSSAITASDTTIPLVAAPTAQEGYLVIEADSSTNREIIYYTSVSGSSVVCPSVGAGRGVGGTSARAHSSGVSVKMNTVAEQFEALQDATAIASSSIGNRQLALGVFVQAGYSSSSAVSTTTTVLPADGTTPQNTEGTEILTVSITPKSATNILLIEASTLLAGNAGVNNYVGALFQDATAAALAASSQPQPAANAASQLTVSHAMAAGTTSSTTFKFRVGPGAAGTLTINGSAGSVLYGAGTTKSILKVTEYKAS